MNGSSASDKNVVDKGFVEHSGENLGNGLRRRNLTVTVSSDHNNTEIYCRGIGTDMNVNSKISTLTVQGKKSYAYNVHVHVWIVTILCHDEYSVKKSL